MATQKIRIKLLIDATGNYCGYGWKDASSADINETLYDVIDGPAMKEYWLVAEVPIPTTTIPVIETVVEQAETASTATQPPTKEDV